MYKEEEIQRIRNRIESYVQALNLLLNTIIGYAIWKSRWQGAFADLSLRKTLIDVEAQLAKLHASLVASSDSPANW